MPLAFAQPPDSKERLLALAADLLGEIEELDLDTIDGEFYWRWCRADLLEPRTLLPRLPRPVGMPDPKRDDRLGYEEPALAGVLEPEGLFDYLRESLRFVEDVLRFSDRLAQRFPRVVWQRLLYGERVAMRAAEIEIQNQDAEERWDRIVRLRVFSGAWNGRQVEDEIRLHIEDHSIEDNEKLVNAVDDLSVRMRFAFVDAHHGQEATFGDDVSRGSYVLVEAPLPLPPRDAIAREYEALVRQQRGWHLHLPGSGSRQEKVVALRTWVIGLLANQGVAVNDAIDLFSLRLHLEPISQSCFGGDRKRLLERVPEAEPYIHALMGRADRNTRGARSPSLVSGDLEPLVTQPSGARPELFP